MNQEKISRWLLAGAALSCLAQLFWFGSKSIHQIAIDDTDYLGIARHLRDHQFHAAIQDFRSPLISWMVAAGSFFDGDFVRIGKVFGIGSFLLSMVLLYFFTKSLWHSKLAASVAVLWFSFCRGLAASAVAMVAPDFLLVALVLGYFIVLLQCLRTDERRYWTLLGGIHALAFLAKAFALPWLAVCTILAVVLARPWKQWAGRLILAGFIPLLIAATWAGVLQSKYGVYTTGTQFKANFLQWTHAGGGGYKGAYHILLDTKPFLDEYGVSDPMPPGSAPWRYEINARRAIPGLLSNELYNLPRAMKELVILVTPGGVLAFVLTLALLARRKDASAAKFILATVVLLGTISLMLAYCMLVFDGRYVYPVVPLVLAVAVGAFVEQTTPKARFVRDVAAAFAVLGVIASVLYSSSPFRTLDRDFQISCYRTGESLRARSGTTVVSVGLGPYPEHGVGWEAGYKSAYFGNRRLIATTEKLPDSGEMIALLDDISTAAPDTVLVWGRPGEQRYEGLMQQLILSSSKNMSSGNSTEILTDPSLGEVGRAIFIQRR